MAVNTDAGNRSLGRATRGLIYLALGLYALSCVLPAVDNEIGVFCLIFGWLAIVGGWLPWLANFALWIGLVSSVNDRPRLALVFGAVAIMLGLSSILLLSHLRIGYAFWQSSFIVFGIGALLEYRRCRT